MRRKCEPIKRYVKRLLPNGLEAWMLFVLPPADSEPRETTTSRALWGFHSGKLRSDTEYAP